MADLEFTIRKALKQLEAEGCDVSGIDVPKLAEAVIAEYASGADGNVEEIVMDLHDTVGLEEFGLHCPD